VSEVTTYVNDAQDYDQIRAKVVTAIFAFVIAVTVLIVIGFFIRIKAIFNTVAAFGFVLLVLLWLSGSIHFVVGMVLSDSCPVVNTVVQGLLPTDGEAATVLQGCLYDDRSVLDSMNITAFNLSNVFDYKEDFNSFSSFASSFDFNSMDDYFNSIQGLYVYNLTAVAQNLTNGWNQSIIYTTLDSLNNQTKPDTFTLQDYQNASPNDYSNPHLVAALQTNITVEVAYNQSLYKAAQQLVDAQISITNMLANFSHFQMEYGGIKTDVQTLGTTNITNCLNIIDYLQDNITAFFELGNCSFLGTTYNEILLSLCGTMQPAVDLLTIAQFLAGLALIPMVITAEIMSFRIGKSSRISPCGDDEYADEESASSKRPKRSHSMGKISDYAAAATDSPILNSRPPTITATIAQSPMAPTPDYNYSSSVSIGEQE